MDKKCSRVREKRWIRVVSASSLENYQSTTLSWLLNDISVEFVLSTALDWIKSCG